MYLWNDETIKWLEAAAQYSKYYKILAQRIKALLPENPNLLELGCGTGLLTRELATFAAHVTAVDIDARAAEEVSRSGLGNTSIICNDAGKFIPDGVYDAAIYCYYGGAEEIVHTVQHGKCRVVIAVGSVTDRHNFSLDGNRRRCFLGLLEMLDRRGIPYTLEKHDLDFSQPVRSLDEAIRFFTHYSGNGTAPSLAEVQKKLVSQDDCAYPYIIPALRNLGIAIIKGKG